MRHPTLETYFFHYQTKRRKKEKPNRWSFSPFGRAVGGFQRDENMAGLPLKDLWWVTSVSGE
ncbi:hypothetical protein TNIN_453421, partial [Trichonephila inaurata madagascariensis]